MTAPLNPDDPRLTSYALGELEGDEREAVGAELRDDPQLVRELDEIQQLGLELEQALGAEPCPSLSQAERGAIEAALAQEPRDVRSLPAASGEALRDRLPLRSGWFPWIGPIGVAAVLMVTAVNLFGVRVDESIQGSTLALVQHTDPPAADGSDQDPDGFKQGVEWTTETGDSVRLRAVGDKWVPWAGKAGQEYDRALHGAIQRNEAPGAGAGRPDASPADTGLGLAFPAQPQPPVALSSGALEVDPQLIDGVLGGGTRAGYLVVDGDRLTAEEAEAGRLAEVQLLRADATLNSVLLPSGTAGAAAPEVPPASTGPQGQGTTSGPSLPVGDPAPIVGGLFGLPPEGGQQRPGDEAGGVRITSERRVRTSSRLHAKPFISVAQQPLSTFAIDVDTASYSTVRKHLRRGVLPPPEAVRVEELVNYFPYEDAPPGPDAAHPFAVHTEVAACPWNPGNTLVRVALQGRVQDFAQRPPTNLVFLLDVSGSMNRPNRLPLVKQALRLLVEQLGENDQLALVVYSGAAGLVLPSTPCDRREEVLRAIERLQAGGSTNGGAGIELAYRAAIEQFVEGGVNRVVLCTDGDFNVGISRRDALQAFIAEKARSGVFLSVLGFGMGRSDERLEALADRGNGHYAYIDDLREAKKVLVEELSGTLLAIAKDVKIQVELNPTRVQAYRLLGYENRVLAARDFNDDRKDAGEIGAGHCVTAFYELIPAGEALGPAEVDPLRYQPRPVPLHEGAHAGELLNVKLRYKQPEGQVSQLLTQPVLAAATPFRDASQDMRFAAAVAAFGMELRAPGASAAGNLAMVEELAMGALGADRGGYRAEFLELVRQARAIVR